MINLNDILSRLTIQTLNRKHFKLYTEITKKQSVINIDVSENVSLNVDRY